MPIVGNSSLKLLLSTGKGIGKGRALDNVFVERLWRSVKYEEVYLKDYSDIWDAEKNLREYFKFYNQERFHQALDYLTPDQVYFGSVDKTKKRA